MQFQIRVLMAWLLLFCAVTSLKSQPQTEQALLQYVQDAHRGSRELLRTCSCRMEFRSTLAEPNSAAKIDSFTSYFWYSPPTLRCKVHHHGTTTDYIWSESIKQAVTQVAGAKRANATRSRSNQHIPRGDAFIRGLLILQVPGTSDCVPFEQFLARSKKGAEAKKVHLDSKEMIRVRAKFHEPDSEQWSVELWFDPSVNYLVRKKRYTSQDNYVLEDEVPEFQESGGGVFFPKKATGRSGSGGVFHHEHETTFSEIKLNHKLPDGIFKLQYPDGVYLRDNIRGVRYKVDSAGNRKSPEEVLTSKKVAPPPPAPQEPRRFQTASEEEPFRWEFMILPASMLLLCCAMSVAIVRRGWWTIRRK